LPEVADGEVNGAAHFLVEKHFLGEATNLVVCPDGNFAHIAVPGFRF
jgi:hypothetical protein